MNSDQNNKVSIRLQKHLAQCGIASRRKGEALIRAGKVRVNGQVVTLLGTKIDPEKDKVVVEKGEAPKEPKVEKKVYYKMYKPVGVVSACSDAHEKTVIDLLKDVPYRLYPVGRLDKESEGLLVLTNDGELANRLTHPRYEHEKEYEVETARPLTARMLTEMERGIVLDGEKTLPARIVLDDQKQFRIIIKEGKNRQIRRMLEAVGNQATRLLRVRISRVRLGKMKPGEYLPLTANERRALSL